jgi:hypothetical protein
MILSIVGIALTSITFGQLPSQEDGGMLFYKLSYNSVNERLEHYVNEIPHRGAYGDHFDAPLSSITFFEPMEKDIELENWMTEPFEIGYYEEDLTVENWMIEPFEIGFHEAEISMESWMTHPFILEEDLQVEDWMHSSWF